MIPLSIRSRDGLNLVGSSWIPENKPKAALAIIHGLGEHHKRYLHVAEFYNLKGISVYSMDLRGHGESDGRKGHSPSGIALGKDIEQLLLRIREDDLDIPIILYGHSMGGNLVLDYLLRNPGREEISASIITSPWIRLSVPPSTFTIRLVNLMDKIFPTLQQFNGLDVNDLSRDKKVVEDYKADPLVHDKISVRLFRICHGNGINALENASGLNTPALLMHGTEDRITSPVASSEFSEKANVEFKQWEGFFHEIHNEPEYLQVLNYQYQWLKQTVTELSSDPENL